MDEPSPPPTAAELGISDAQYERIIRDLAQRRTPGETPPVVPPPAKRGRGRRRLVLLGIAVVLVALPRAVIAGVQHSGDPVYAFMAMNGDQPVTYSSCRPIQVAVYPEGGPPNAEALVREAVGQMRADTGLDIAVIGSYGGHAPNWNFKAANVTPEDPISVSWQDGSTLDAMTDDVAGLGGSPYVRTPGGGLRYVAGAIALSRDYYAKLDERHDHDEELAVLLHEFGHVFGLDHVASPGQLMYHDNVGRTTFGAGDLKGLRLLGQGPCV